MAAHHPFARGAVDIRLLFGFWLRDAQMLVYRTPHARTDVELSSCTAVLPQVA